MIGAMRPLVIDLCRLSLIVGRGLVQRCVESAALGRPGLIGANRCQAFAGARLLTYRYDRYARLRGSALRSKRLPLTQELASGM